MHSFEVNTSNQTQADLNPFQYLNDHDLFPYWTLVELVLTLGWPISPSFCRLGNALQMSLFLSAWVLLIAVRHKSSQVTASYRLVLQPFDLSKKEELFGNLSAEKSLSALQNQSENLDGSSYFFL